MHQLYPSFPNPLLSLSQDNLYRLPLQSHPDQASVLCHLCLSANNLTTEAELRLAVEASLIPLPAHGH
jgi:hypothetical protein